MQAKPVGTFTPVPYRSLFGCVTRPDGVEPTVVHQDLCMPRPPLEQYQKPSAPIKTADALYVAGPSTHAHVEMQRTCATLSQTDSQTDRLAGPRNQDHHPKL